MNKESMEEIIEKLESKRTDCIAFTKKYQARRMDDLFQYYKGAKWAIDFALSAINEFKEKS